MMIQIICGRGEKQFSIVMNPSFGHTIHIYPWHIWIYSLYLTEHCCLSPYLSSLTLSPLIHSSCLFISFVIISHSIMHFMSSPPLCWLVCCNKTNGICIIIQARTSWTASSTWTPTPMSGPTSPPSLTIHHHHHHHSGTWLPISSVRHKPTVGGECPVPVRCLMGRWSHNYNYTTNRKGWRSTVQV